jgi:hypothetical protein
MHVHKQAMLAWMLGYRAMERSRLLVYGGFLVVSEAGAKQAALLSVQGVCSLKLVGHMHA